MANARKVRAPVGTGKSLRPTSARMEDCTADMSYFCAAARSAKTLSYDVVISVGIGYLTVMRARTISASSDKRTKGNPSIVSSLDGWGSENISLKNCDEEASTALWTRKLAKSDD